MPSAPFISSYAILQSWHLYQATGQRLLFYGTMPLMWLSGLGTRPCLSHSRSHSPPFSLLTLTSTILTLAFYSMTQDSQCHFRFSFHLHSYQLHQRAMCFSAPHPEGPRWGSGERGQNKETLTTYRALIRSLMP